MPNQKGLIHILVVLILLAGLGATLYLSQHTQIFKPKAYEQTQSDQVTKLTAYLLEAKEKYDNRTSADGREPNPVEMVRIAKERRDKLLVEVKNNPQAFLEHATLYSQRDSFPIEVQDLIEEEKTVQGELTVLHGHQDINDTGKFVFLLKEQENYNLHFTTTPPNLFTTTPPNLLTGAQIRVTGVNLDNELVLREKAATDDITTSSSSLNVTGTRRMAILLVNTEPNETPVITQDYLREVLVTAQDSVNNFFTENSFGQFRGFPPDFFGWYDIPITNTPNRTCDGDGRHYIATAADATAQASGVNLSQYQNIAYIINTREGTGCGAWGTLGGNPGRTWIGTNNDPGSVGGSRPYPDIFAHELGHTLGLHHAGSLICGSLPNLMPVDRYENCRVNEAAGDSIMAATQPYYHFNAPHKIFLGWIPTSQIQTVTSDGVYTISLTLQSAGEGTRILKIPKVDTNEYYFISYPQPYNLDLFNAIGTSGIDIFRRPGTSINISNENPAIPTKLITARPKTDFLSPASSYFADGGEIFDTMNGIRIKQLSSNFTSTTVEVKFLPPLFTPTPTPAPVRVCATDSECGDGMRCQLPVCANPDPEQICKEAQDKTKCFAQVEQKATQRCAGRCVKALGF